MLNKFKDIDKFGHKVELNFDRKGSEHKTVIGAIFSVLVNVLMLVYVVSLVKKLVYNGDDSISLVTKYENADSLEVKIKDTNVVPMFGLLNIKTHMFMEYDEEVQKYIKIEFSYSKLDATVVPPIYEH